MASVHSSLSQNWESFKPESKLLASPLMAPIVLPYILPYIPPFLSLDYSSVRARASAWTKEGAIADECSEVCSCRKEGLFSRAS